MDKNHSVEANLDKIQALIDAVNRLYKASNDLTFSAIMFQIDSLRSLSNETVQSLEAIRKTLKQ